MRMYDIMRRHYTSQHKTIDNETDFKKFNNIKNIQFPKNLTCTNYSYAAVSLVRRKRQMRIEEPFSFKKDQYASSKL